MGMKITDNCCGCSACANICDKNAIRMKMDADNFIYASVDESLCVNCNKCRKVCPDLKYEKYTSEECYAATSLDASAKKSSSGGIFALIAKKFLEQYNGLVYGTTISSSFDAYVIGIDSIEKLPLLQGSKYTQSDMGNIYKEIKENIAKGKKVLFCGTPCQTSALKNFVGESSQLYTLDIVCHGVPSNHMFKDYIRFLEEKSKKKIAEFIFRDKEQGQDVRGKVKFSLGEERKLKHYQSSYYALFLNGSIYRESCYSCRYADVARVGDITLCDYWGVDIEDPEFFNTVKEKGLVGISGVIVNSSKGKELFSVIREQLLYKETEKEKIAAHNPNLMKPSSLNKDRKELFELYRNKGYQSVDKLYCKKNRTKNTIRNIYETLPSGIKKEIIRLRGLYK